MALKRAGRYLLAVIIIFTLNFFIPRAMPGDPVTHLLGENYVVTPEALADIRAELGLDKPLSFQYVNYWKNIFSLNLGYSYHLHTRVFHAIVYRMAWTLAFSGIAIVISLVAGSLWGALSAWGKNTLKKKLTVSFFVAIYSTPPFFLSFLCLYTLSFKLNLFPMKGFYETGSALDIIRHFLLPVLVLSLSLISRNFIIMRGSVMQEKSKHYVLYARAKGLSNRKILFRHVLKNASLPIITLTALDFGFILSGALFIEIVFSMNGMGTLLYEALMSRDYPVLQGLLLIITLMVVLANFTADLLYSAIDPRVRASQ